MVRKTATEAIVVQSINPYCHDGNSENGKYFAQCNLIGDKH